MPIAILLVAFVAVLSVYVLIVRAGGFRFPWIHFYVRGKESGFSFGEVNLLRRVAIENKLENPTSLFWSVKTLDRCIRSAIIGFRAAGSENTEKCHEFLNKLFDFRRRVEFDQPKHRLGIASTRNIDPGQTLKIVLEGSGIYLSKLIENNRKYLALTYPRGNPLPPGFSWRDQVLKLHFWRKEDAGYFFEAKVIGDYLDRKVPILHVSHSDNLVRAQKRRSVRREANLPATLFPLRSIEHANETIETRGGYRCKLIDISEDGAAIVIGGRAKAGLPVKIQVTLNSESVALSGVIKSVTFRQKNNASILHLEAKPPTVSMRVRILTFVYDLFSEVENATQLEGAYPAGSPPAGAPSSEVPPKNSKRKLTPRQRAAEQKSEKSV